MKEKISGKGAIKAGERFTLFTSNEDMNDMVNMVKPLEDSSLLINAVTETVKHETKK